MPYEQLSSQSPACLRHYEWVSKRTAVHLARRPDSRPRKLSHAVRSQPSAPTPEVGKTGREAGLPRESGLPRRQGSLRSR